MSVRRASMAVICVIIAAVLSAQEPSPPRVTYQDLLNGFKDPSRWLTYSGDYTGQRHSPLKQITPENVSRLSPQWTFQTETMAFGTYKGFEGTPIVLDGILYETGLNNYAWALDARTGRQIWRYRRDLPERLTYCCGPGNRGFAILGDRLFMVTLDAHLVALSIKTGRVVWDTAFEDYKRGYAATLAPLVIKNKVIVGVAGGEYPIRGFIDAYNAEDGTRAWRFYTTPAPGEPGSDTWPSPDAMARGGGGVWMTGSYDPELNLTYWGVGNPNPDYWGDDRKGDNLYTDSLVALDSDTGKLRWHYQFTPHDVHDWDANHIPVLADIMVGGQPSKVVMVANRNGFFYVLDRVTGKFLLGKPFVKTTWAKEFTAQGRPIVLNEYGTADACLPDQRGGTNFMAPSFDPSLKLFFVNARETCALFVPMKPEIRSDGPVQPIMGGAPQRVGTTNPWGALRAIDPMTGERRWEFRYPTPSMAGVLTTASGLVFSGDNEGNVIAFNSQTGKDLWHYQTGSPIWGAAPSTYMLDGRQWLVIPSGSTLTAFALPEIGGAATIQGRR